MGVKDLWQLLSPVGRRVSIETLEGKTLAIDVSIWITQFIKSMRDEDGKMMKNAHIIGTLRRILKLLFHRIRPLFVFDGATPNLKLRTISARRRTHDQHDLNKKVSVQRILLAQLRQHRLNGGSQIISDDQAAPTNFSSSFNLLNDNRVDINTTISTSVDHTVTSYDIDGDTDDVQWISGGYDNLPRKKDLHDDEEEERTNGTRPKKRGRGGQSDDEGDSFGWNMPEDHNDLSAEALEAMPTHIRKSLIEEARRRERVRSRASYLPVASNPDLYSQTQLANFLNTSKLNQRFASVQQAVDKRSVGKHIASEGGKKFSVAEREEDEEDEAEAEPLSSAPPNSLLSDNIHTEFCLNIPDSEDEGDENDDVSVGSYFMHSSEDEEDKEEVEDPEKIFASGGVAVDKPNSFNSSHAISHVNSGAGTDVRIIAKSSLSSDYNTTNRGRRVIVVDEDEEEEECKIQCETTVPEVAEVVANAGDTIALRVSSEAAAQEVVPNFYSCLHQGDEDDDDVDWQSVEDEEAEEVEEVLQASEVAVQVHESAEIKSHSSFVDLTSLSSDGEGEDVSDQSRNDTVNANHSERKVSESHDQYQRVMHTAASMADWAGRAVRSALKEHMTGSGQTDASPSSATPSTWEPVPQNYSESSSSSSSSSSAPAASWAHYPPAASQFASQQEERQWEANEERSARRALASAQRDTESLTEEMKADVLELLRAFDLPFIVAPFEAEAQCCVLEQLGLVDGVVTEDSDAFLFGANAVYRHIFNDKKFVEVYLSADVQKGLGLSREELVAFAYFLGSDYTEGVNGVGIVNAVEILQAFPMRADRGGPIKGLRRFRAWLEGFDAVVALKTQFTEAHSGGKEKRRKRVDAEDEDEEEEELAAEEEEEAKLIAFQKKHQNGRSKWTVPDSFPNEQVAEAYLNPAASRDAEQFRWTVPDAGRIRAYCAETLGWTKQEMDVSIDPVIAKYCERSVQTRIDSHFLSYRDDSRFAKIASDRLRTAVVQITGKKTALALGGRRVPPKKRIKKDKVQEEPVD